MASASFDLEISAAVEYLAAQLLASGSPHSAPLADALKAELEQHYTGHWYPKEAHRGCAFRSLTCNGESQFDPLIVRAVKRAAIAREHLLPKVFILWVNPGEVKVNEAGAKRHVYTAAGCTPNPYSKPKVNVAPTRLNVASESERSRDGSSSNSSSAPASPSASRNVSPKASPVLEPTAAKLSPSAINFIPRSAPYSSAGSGSSDSDSDSEQPPATYQQQAPAPAFAPPPPPPPMPGMQGMQGFFMPGWPMAPGMAQPAWQPQVAAAGWQPMPYNQYSTVEAH